MWNRTLMSDFRAQSRLWAAFLLFQEAAKRSFWGAKNMVFNTTKLVIFFLIFLQKSTKNHLKHNLLFYNNLRLKNISKQHIWRIFDNTLGAFFTTHLAQVWQHTWRIFDNTLGAFLATHLAHLQCIIRDS